MVRRKNPGGKLRKCIVASCTVKLKNSDFPLHYSQIHGSETGRFECSQCGYSCSNSDICIDNHIDKAHEKEDKAEASFNPKRKSDSPRITNQCTDQCRDEKVKVSGRSKAFKKDSKKVNENPLPVREVERSSHNPSIRLSKISQTRATNPAGNMNGQNGSVVRAKKSRVNSNENNVNKRKSNDGEQSNIENTPKRRKSDEAETSSGIRNTARSSVQAGKGKPNKSVVTSETPGVEFRQAIFGDSDDEDTADNHTETRQMEGNVETENEGRSSRLNDQDEDSDNYEGDTNYDEENEQVETINPPIDVEEREPSAAERKRRREEIDREAYFESFTKAHNRYTLPMFEDLLMDLLRKWTNNPEQKTEELITNIGGKNPHVMDVNDMMCPPKFGDEALIESIHGCVLESSRRLQIHMINLLISTSVNFKGELARRIWQSLMMETAKYRYAMSEQVGENILREQILALRVLYDAYRKAME